MTFIVDIPPTAEPVALADLKTRLRVDHGHDDALMNRLIKAARHYIEASLNIAMVTRTLTLYERHFYSGVIPLKLWPVKEIIEVFSLVNGEATPIENNLYAVDISAKPPKLYLKRGQYFMPHGQNETIGIKLQAGFGAAEDVPDDLREATLQLAAEWYAPGEGLSPERVLHMLAHYREVRL